MILPEVRDQHPQRSDEEEEQQKLYIRREMKEQLKQTEVYIHN